ncbi:MAG: hypothetical protein IJY90_00850 [Clostridia bacterium]|nr:hypothetical protein [Clostridia bacterium]
MLKLRRLLSLGYLPARGNQSYRMVHTSTAREMTFLVNCVAHTFFNLTNQQLENFDSLDGMNFRGFLFEDEDCSVSYKRVIDFVKRTGLNVTNTSFKAPVEDNSWRVAVYFQIDDNGKYGADFHFLLEENDGMWSSKEGSFPDLIYYSKPPKILASHHDKTKQYKLHGYLRVSNPNIELQNAQNVD